MESRKRASVQFIADPLHQMVVEPQVMHDCQTHSQQLLRLEQVANIGAGIVAAGRAAAGGVNGALIPLVLGIFDVDDAAPGVQVAVAGIPAGHHAVKQIDTTGNRLNDVAWGANAHQVADLILGHIGLYFADHLVHDLRRLADGKPAESPKTPEEMTAAYKAAIEGARSEEDNEYNTILTSSDDDMAELIFGLLNVSEEDMTAYAISVSAMNVRAYGVAAILPAAGKEDLVLEGLNSFVENQKRSFEQYLADQYEIAKEAKVGTLEDGTVLLVMCENQDAVYDSIKDALS